MGQISNIPTTAGYILTQLRDLFTNKTTDGSGNITLTLTRTPTSINNVAVQCLNAGYTAFASALTDTSLTILVKKLKYDKPTTIATNTTLANMPSGVSSDSTASGFTITSTDCSAESNNGGNNTTNNFASKDHTHNVTIDKVITHSHGVDVTFTETDLPTAISVSGLNFMVIYN